MQPPTTTAPPPLARIDERLEQRARRAVSFDALPSAVRRRLVDAVNGRPGATPVLHARVTGPALGDAVDGLPLGLVPLLASPLLLPIALVGHFLGTTAAAIAAALLAVPLLWSALEFAMLRERLQKLPLRPGEYVLPGQQVRLDVHGQVTFSRPISLAAKGTALVTRHQTNWMRGKVVSRTEVRHSHALVLEWNDGSKIALPVRNQQESGALFDQLRAAAARLCDAEIASDTATVQRLDPFFECDATGVWERSPSATEPPLWPPRRVARDRALTLGAAMIPLLFVLARDSWERLRRSWPGDTSSPRPSTDTHQTPPAATSARPAARTAPDAGEAPRGGLREEPGFSRSFDAWTCDAGNHRFEGVTLSGLALVIRGECAMKLTRCTVRGNASILVSVGGDANLQLDGCLVEHGVRAITLLAGGHSTVSVHGGSLRGGEIAVHAADHARVALSGVSAEGSRLAIEAIERARVRVEGSTLLGATSTSNHARIEDGGDNTGLAR